MAAREQREVTGRAQGQDIFSKGMPSETHFLQVGLTFHQLSIVY
jgi:hypothetical protein